MEDVYWQGQKLPPRRPNHVWGFRIYPGGRTEVKQVHEDVLVTPLEAVNKLLSDEWATVWLDDARITVVMWQQARVED